MKIYWCISIFILEIKWQAFAANCIPGPVRNLSVELLFRQDIVVNWDPPENDDCPVDGYSLYSDPELDVKIVGTTAYVTILRSCKNYQLAVCAQSNKTEGPKSKVNVNLPEPNLTFYKLKEIDDLTIIDNNLVAKWIPDDVISVCVPFYSVQISTTETSNDSTLSKKTSTFSFNTTQTSYIIGPKGSTTCNGEYTVDVYPYTQQYMKGYTSSVSLVCTECCN